MKGGYEMDVIRFIFDSFWHFIGTVIIIVVILDGISEIVGRIKSK